MFKRLVAVATTTALTVAMAVTAFAAGSLNDAEKDIIKALDGKVPANYVAEVQKVLEDENVNVSAADAKTAIANIDKAKEIVDKAGIKNVDELKANATVLKQVQDLVSSTAALKSVNVKVSFDAKSGKPSVATKDGKVVLADASIAKTGVDFSTTAAVVAGLGLSVAGIAVIAKKKDLVNA
ncbi:unknown [Roseburia sp. CAG:303]|nr:unknown [Roseburia sp. CAG:303]